MAREFAKPFYDSAAWQKCRATFIAGRVAIDGGMCQRCGQELGYIVHHREWLTPDNIVDPDVALNHENLEYVCLACHNRIEQGEEEPRYRFTVDGQVEAYSPPFESVRKGMTETDADPPCETREICKTPSPRKEGDLFGRN